MTRFILLATIVAMIMLISAPAWAQVTASEKPPTTSKVAGGGISAFSEADGSLNLDLGNLKGEPGRDGKNGRNGRDGEDGRGVSLKWCPNGTLTAYYTDGTNETLITGLLGVQDMYIDYGGTLFLVLSNGEKRPILNFEEMVQKMIGDREQRSVSSLPSWFWPAIIIILLVAFAILISFAKGSSDKLCHQNESKRIENGETLIMSAVVNGFTCSYEEEGKSGRQEFTIGGADKKQTPREHLEDAWEKKVVDGFAENLDRKLQEVVKRMELPQKGDKPLTPYTPEPVDYFRNWDGLDTFHIPFISEKLADKEAKERNIPGEHYKVVKKGVGYKVVPK